MTDEQKAAFVLAAVARVNARIAGMQAENAYHLSTNAPDLLYTEPAFLCVIDEEGISHNDVLAMFR